MLASATASRWTDLPPATLIIAWLVGDHHSIWTSVDLPTLTGPTRAALTGVRG